MATLKLSESTNKQVIDEINNSSKLSDANKFTNTNEIEIDVNDANKNTAFFRVSAKNNANTEQIANISPKEKSFTRNDIPLTSKDLEVATVKFAKDLNAATLIRQKGKPTETTNPLFDHAIYVDVETGMMYLCTDKTTNKNSWISIAGQVTGNMPAAPEPGGEGFGAGNAPQALVDRYKMTPEEGCFDPTSINYGSYKDPHGSIMVWVPKMYMKTSGETGDPYWGLKVELSNTKKPGYWLPRCFINAGKEIDGFWIDRYLPSELNGKPCAVRGGNPFSAAQGYFPVQDLPGMTTGYNTSVACYEAAKIRGPEYSLLPCFHFNFLHKMSRAVYQRAFESNDFSKVGWAEKGGTRNFPKGFINQYLTNDGLDYKNAHMYLSGYVCKTGSVSDANLPKITQNGQANGICDLFRSMYCTGPGYWNNGRTHYVFKKSSNFKDVDHTNYNSTTLYEPLTITGRNHFNTSYVGYFPSDSANWLSNTSDENSLDWLYDELYLIKSGLKGSETAALNQLVYWMFSYDTSFKFWYYSGGFWLAVATGNDMIFYLVYDHGSHGDFGFRLCLIPD